MTISYTQVVIQKQDTSQDTVFFAFNYYIMYYYIKTNIV